MAWYHIIPNPFLDSMLRITIFKRFLTNSVLSQAVLMQHQSALINEQNQRQAIIQTNAELSWIKNQQNVRLKSPIFNGQNIIKSEFCVFVKYSLCTKPHKHAIMGQYLASTGPMLPASDQYWPGTGTYRHVYKEGTIS